MTKNKATFQPTVRPDWAGAMDYISESEQVKIFQAILMFPSVDLIESAFWQKTIKPDLEQQYKTFIESCQKKAIGIRKRWENEKSIDMNTNVIDNYTNVIDKDSPLKNKIKNKNNVEEEDNNISTTRINNQNNQKNQIDNQIEKTRIHNALEVFGNSFKATDAVVDIFDRPDGTTREGIRIKNPRLMAFVRQRFDSNVLSKVSDWAIDHNQRGHTYNATSLLKLLCKFQSNVEPTINFNSVQAEYLTFEYKQPQK